MCGRFQLTATPDEVRRLFAFLDRPNFPPRDDIRPTEPIGVVARREGERRFVLAPLRDLAPELVDEEDLGLAEGSVHRVEDL